MCLNIIIPIFFLQYWTVDIDTFLLQYWTKISILAFFCLISMPTYDHHLLWGPLLSHSFFLHLFKLFLNKNIESFLTSLIFKRTLPEEEVTAVSPGREVNLNTRISTLVSNWIFSSVLRIRNGRYFKLDPVLQTALDPAVDLVWFILIFRVSGTSLRIKCFFKC